MIRLRVTSATVAVAFGVGIGIAGLRAQGPAGPPIAAPLPAGVVVAQGQTSSGSRWLAEKPANWNGTLLLWSHGYAPTLRPAESGPARAKAVLLTSGYALLGSSYSAAGWAVAEAVPDQIAALDAFVAAVGAPRRVIAWGQSMGGLVTSALVERHADRFAAGLSICASSGGAVGMMNMALDGAFAFVTLIAPEAGIRVVNTGDDMANTRLVQAALEQARQTAEGRARLALAAVLAGLPSWTAQPAAPAAQADEMIRSFAAGVFLPRADQEARARGGYSWNTGVDYREQLRASGRAELVDTLYRAAGTSLEADLARLNGAPRISADPAAVAYMIANFTPTGRIGVPVLALQTLGDGMTSPSLQRGYADAVREAGRGDLIREAWNGRPGHCTSSQGEMLASLRALEQRVDTGRWDVAPDTLNRFAREAGEAAPTFVATLPAPALRPCRAEGAACADRVR